MSIEVICPNGHVLKVKEKHAGQTGLCPKCQARVLVPELPVAAGSLNDDAILGMLKGDDESLPVHEEAKHRDPSRSSDSTLLTSSSILKVRKKTCKRCGREVPGQFTICPHCRTYLSDIGERKPAGPEPCSKCGVMPQPDDVFCVSCGNDLRME